MKKLLNICLLIFCFFLFFNSCQARCEMLGKGVIYLRILDETGKALPDTYEQNLIVKESVYDRSKDNPPLVLNENDDLIFELGRVEVTYTDCKRLQKRDPFTDEEIKNALNGAGSFTIKDKSGKYKTVVDAKYSDYLVSIERPKEQETFIYFEPKHIYHCEIKLAKK